MNQFQIENLIKSLYDLSNPHPSNSNPASSVTVREAERILRYHFNKPSLLKEALTHSSYSDGTISYERLEIVGDAALSLALTKNLYLSNPQLGPGQISKLRSANLTNEKLARVAVRHNIYPLVLHNSPTLDKEVENFTKAVLQEPEGGSTTKAPKGGSTPKAPKVLADVVEAIAAAIYEDCNFNLDIMWKVVKKLLKPLIRADSFGEQPVTTPHQLCQKKGKDDEFHTRQKGKIAIFNVLVEGELVGCVSTSKQKTVARPNAAKDAHEKMRGEKSNDSIKTQHKKVGNEEEAKQRLNEFCMKRHWPPAVYKLKEKGTTPNQNFICSVHVGTKNDHFTALGEYRPRVKDAEKSAAFKMLSIFHNP